jgi:hypothetical protein
MAWLLRGRLSPVARRVNRTTFMSECLRIPVASPDLLSAWAEGSPAFPQQTQAQIRRPCFSLAARIDWPPHDRRFALAPLLASFCGWQWPDHSQRNHATLTWIVPHLCVCQIDDWPGQLERCIGLPPGLTLTTASLRPMRWGPVGRALAPPRQLMDEGCVCGMRCEEPRPAHRGRAWGSGDATHTGNSRMVRGR